MFAFHTYSKLQQLHLVMVSQKFYPTGITKLFLPVLLKHNSGKYKVFQGYNVYTYTG